MHRRLALRYKEQGEDNSYRNRVFRLVKGPTHDNISYRKSRRVTAGTKRGGSIVVGALKDMDLDLDHIFNLGQLILVRFTVVLSSIF